MPGIVGIISEGPAEKCQRLLRSMVASMKHEEFYHAATYHAPNMGVYAGSVVLDPAPESQIFFNEQKDVILIFSGECFFDPTVGSELHQRGHHVGDVQAAWLVHLYEERGEQFVEDLNGLFSGLLIDQRQRKVFLFNDRFGSERIYCHQTSVATYFASEAKALLCILPQLTTFDEEGVAQFLTYGCTLGSRTLFRGIHLLPGGSLWRFENGSCHKTRYFSPGTWELQPTLSAESFEETFQETFKRILPHYFESRSGIGISLTGGLDTRTIMACRPKAGRNIVCYTFSGINGETLDDRLAARVANVCGLEHQLLRIKSDFFSDFAAHVDRTIYVTDGCFGVTGAHEIYLNRQARRLAPVRLTGLFGSEILRGVSTFKPVGLSSSLINPEFEPTVSALSSEAAVEPNHPITRSAFRNVPWNLFGSAAASRSQVTLRTPYLDNEIVALAYQAPQSLRRSPLPALRLVRNNNSVLSRIPTDRGYAGENQGLLYVLRRLLSEGTFKIDYYNSEGLPFGLSSLDSVFRRLSSGLGLLGLHKYLPYRHWFRRELAEYINDKLAEARSRQMPFWNSDFIGSMAKDHIRGRKNYACEINAVLTLEAVERLFFRDAPYEKFNMERSKNKNLQKEPALTR